MKRGYDSPGYTVVEVLIFLAISSALFVSAYITFGGQHRRTAFATSIRDVELVIQDVINDVSTGFYGDTQATNVFTCSQSASGPRITMGTSDQGSNKECTLIGRAIHFGVQGTNGEAYKIYEVVGLRNAFNTTKNAKDLDEALPIALTDRSGPPAEPPTVYWPGGLRVERVTAFTSTGQKNTGTVAFIASLSNTTSTGTLQSGSQTVNVYPLGTDTNPSDLGDTVNEVHSHINDLSNASTINPVNGVTVCFTGSLENFHGEITIGFDKSQTTTKTEVKTGGC